MHRVLFSAIAFTLVYLPLETRSASAQEGPPISAVSPKGKLVAGTVLVGPERKPDERPRTVYLFERHPKHLKLVKRLVGHEADVSSIAWTPNGQWLLSGDQKGETLIWDWRAAKVLHRREGKSPVQFLAASPKSDLAATLAFEKAVKKGDLPNPRNTLTIWDLKSNAAVFREEGLEPFEQGQFSLASTFFLAWTATGKAVCFEPRAGKVAAKFESEGPILFAVFAPKNSKVVTATNEGKLIQLWDITTSAEVARFLPEKHHLINIAFSRDGKLLGGYGVESYTAYRKSLMDEFSTGARVLTGIFTMGLSELLAGVGTNRVTTTIPTVYVWNTNTGLLVTRMPAGANTRTRLVNMGFDLPN